MGGVASPFCRDPGAGPGEQYGMCLLGIGAELNLEVSSDSGGGVGDCRDGCSIVMVAIPRESQVPFLVMQMVMITQAFEDW